MSLAGAPGHSPQRVAAAWAVHAFTASGAVVGLAALLAAGSGELPRAALLMLVGLFIDSVDGTLARAVRVREVLPTLDGRRLDDIVDYLNYVIVPGVFLVVAGCLIHWTFAALPVLASAYGFSQTDAKTEDNFFLGFPSYWNVIAIYLWGLGVGALVGTAIVAGFAAAVFVPLKYLYPSQSPVLRRTSLAGAALWLALVAWAVANPSAAASRPVLWVSLSYPAYYLALSFWLGGGRSLGRG